MVAPFQSIESIESDLRVAFPLWILLVLDHGIWRDIRKN